MAQLFLKPAIHFRSGKSSFRKNRSNRFSPPRQLPNRPAFGMTSPEAPDKTDETVIIMVWRTLA